MSDLMQLFRRTLKHEGGFQNDPDDDGNWTGGKKGVGICKGTKYGISAKCLHPDTRLFMRDLTWKRNGDLRVGDELIGVLRDTRGRGHGLQLSPATILALDEINLPCVEIKTAKRTVVCSREHLWWAARNHGSARVYQWVMAQDLDGKYGIAESLEPWSENLSPGAQWLAGVFDGEGCLSNYSLTVYQNEGLVAQRIRSELRSLGMTWNEEGRSANCIVFRVMKNRFALLGQIRPVRLLAKAERFWSGQATHGRYTSVDPVLSIRDVGEQPVMAMITSTGTMIAEGLISHNSYPNLDIANLTEARAIEIFLKDYYLPLKLEAINSAKIRWKLFDIAINLGADDPPRIVRNVLASLGYVGGEYERLNDAEKFWGSDEVPLREIAEWQVRAYVDIVVRNPAKVKYLKTWVGRGFDIGEGL